MNSGGNWIEKLGRAGLLAQGVSYGLVGVLAIELALGKGGKTTSRQGALKSLADSTLGKIVILLFALGFAGYAAWRLAQALFDRGGEGSDPKALGKRAAQLAKAALYIGFAVSAVSLLFGAGGGGGSHEKKATGGVLDWSGGKWIVLAAGIAVVGAGLYQIYRAVSTKFMDDLDTGEMSEGERRWTSGSESSASSPGRLSSASPAGS